MRLLIGKTLFIFTIINILLFILLAIIAIGATQQDFGLFFLCISAILLSFLVLYYCKMTGVFNSNYQKLKKIDDENMVMAKKIELEELKSELSKIKIS